MKKSYITSLSLPRVDVALLLFRVGISALMLTHGIPKMMQFFGGEEILFADPIGIGQMATFTFAVFAEFICSILIILGLGTRLATIPLIVTMAVAGLIVHVPDGMMRQELPLLYMVGYLMLFYAGSGKFSLDYYFLRKKQVEQS